MSVALENVFVRPLDGARRVFWRWSAKTRFGRACMRDRGLRMAVLALGHMSVGLTLTLLVPMWLLLLGPIVLGVPHVAGDVRYLIVKPPLPLGRLGLVLLLGPLALMTGLRLAPADWGLWHAEIEVLLGALAIAGGLIVARTSLERRVVAFACLAGVAALGAHFAYGAILVIAHLHNFVAFAAWLWLYRSEASWSRVAVVGAAYLAVCSLILAGAFDGILLTSTYGGSAAGLDMDHFAPTLAPGIEPVMAMRVVALYAFAQSFHYAVWVRLVPQQMDPRPAPPTFMRTVGRLRQDLGAVGFWLVVVSAVGLPIAALLTNAQDVRYLYLVAVIFHGWLELAVFGALALHRAQGRRVGWGRA